MRVYYNEFDPYAAQWLRNLIAAGYLPEGKVDEADMQGVAGKEITGFVHAHFFAGIGGWPLALRLAGWPADREVWTGSCPCQPYSAAGKGKGDSDARNLWPEFRRFIAERRPATIFGEQVASAAGREWVTGVRVDLEALGYRVGIADLCAAGAGAPHIRQRLWWVANSKRNEEYKEQQKSAETQRAWSTVKPSRRGVARGMGIANDSREDAFQRIPRGPRTERSGSSSGMGLPDIAGREPRQQAPTSMGHGDTAVADGFWSDFDLVSCADGKSRRVEPGTFPLAHGVPARVGKLRAYGNAIVPEVAATFIRAYADCVFASDEATGVE